VTGNNLQLSEELNRRAVRTRLVPNQGRPWERGQEAFKHGDLFGWVRENRGKLVWAALTLISSWVYIGCPRSAKNLGSYEHWAGVIGGILEHAQIASFLDNREAQNEALDADSDDWTSLVNQWNEEFGEAEVTTAQLLETLLDSGDATSDGQLRLELSGTDARSKAVSFGKLLSSRRDAIFGGLKINRLPSKGNQSAKWKLTTVR
jgi:hypothetical protein